MAARAVAASTSHVSFRYAASCRSRSRSVYQWKSGVSKGMPKRACGSSEARMTRG
jgi:hypothetical protein